MKKFAGNILKEITNSTSITDICSREVCQLISPVMDPIVFPEFYLFSSTNHKESAIFLLILVGSIIGVGLVLEEIVKRILLNYNSNNRVIFKKMFEYVVTACIFFYFFKAVIYFVMMKRG
ncbi:hypothetical protein ACRS6Y_04725 [Bacillus cytotoxicus]|uniref:Group-specific protein n=1 Tax=Bacillus cytotoxicus (strain DSM 22905 / CIP 110041 / 391-98 / NVH 391-98) TaxID=315749 RepID=A7GM23_BACCN|nr:hypothetical protein [Bacillus cytotoxicus]ABS21181.1 conserved hypothetical protein [Bacillus cytotoxicus NVH 391-98]AWC31826.1 hypothetical protein CG482_004940 [Bacillus cytotoxicus]AWC35864.1 hypothetical protein CG481_004945 [Bacillus cytotoxicus]AWC43910.1 hypothetical protein CG479_004860 [Bacillus cytotoxicus]AWC60103.1 hypothetical protein CG474_005015 [Bacillus cytotoxicus]